MPNFGIQRGDFAETGTPCWSNNTARKISWSFGGYEDDDSTGRRSGTRTDPSDRRRAGAEATAAAAAKVEPRAVVADVKRILNENYVLPELRPQLAAALDKGLAAGRYNVSDTGVLAERINADLTAVAHDGHLGMHFDPKQAAQLAARPAGAGADDAPPTEEEIRFADRLNHGITQLKVLPGNIRYMETVGFFWGGDKTKEVYDNAMRFLKGGDAIIIDMRQNGGGSPDAVRYMISHFLAANTPDRDLLHARTGRRPLVEPRCASGRKPRRKAALRADRRPQRQRRRGIHRPCRRLQGRRAGRRERPPARAIATNSSPSPAAM